MASAKQVAKFTSIIVSYFIDGYLDLRSPPDGQSATQARAHGFSEKALRKSVIEIVEDDPGSWGISVSTAREIAPIIAKNASAAIDMIEGYSGRRGTFGGGGFGIF